MSEIKVTNENKFDLTSNDFLDVAQQFESPIVAFNIGRVTTNAIQIYTHSVIVMFDITTLCR